MKVIRFYSDDDKIKNEILKKMNMWTLQEGIRIECCTYLNGSKFWDNEHAAPLESTISITNNMVTASVSHAFNSDDEYDVVLCGMFAACPPQDIIDAINEGCVSMVQTVSNHGYILVNDAKRFIKALGKKHDSVIKIRDSYRLAEELNGEIVDKTLEKYIAECYQEDYGYGCCNLQTRKVLASDCFLRGDCVKVSFPNNEMSVMPVYRNRSDFRRYFSILTRGSKNILVRHKMTDDFEEKANVGISSLFVKRITETFKMIQGAKLSQSSQNSFAIPIELKETTFLDLSKIHS